MNILLVGNGAREHCIAEALTASGRAKIFTFAKAANPGIAAISEGYQTGSLKDFSAMAEFAKKVKPDFAFIGPDDPIADGAADLFAEFGIPSVAPRKTVARLESSKSFTRDLLQKYNIPGNPRFRVFHEASGLRAFLDELQGHFVVKADGLTGGKGVRVSGDHLRDAEGAERYARECLAQNGRVVIEEKLIGQEFSLMSFVDGDSVADMVPVQDHKRAFAGDTGPNTGGMGSYSDANHLLPFLTRRDLDDAHAITERVAKALVEETGMPFKGIMYGGFMAVADGVRLIEYNARFGDPEAMNVLPILQTDLIAVCEAILGGTLKNLSLKFESKATVCKYLVPEGYPDNPKAGDKIEVRGGQLKNDPAAPLKMYYASVDQRDGELYLSSSRALAFVGIGGTIAEAEKIAEGACGRVKGPVFHRQDVGTQELIRKRVEQMEKLRSESVEIFQRSLNISLL
ncbi:phosphoribosylamine--glycine ligase [Candidatus Peregrinibacteria bacterium]|nr:phosphoribosylamine--glycine ligase [Candidatus Peregrinibacteria bacterium]